MNICTIVAKNYIAHARVLAESFLDHHPDGTCTVLVVDDIEGYIDADAEPFELVTPAEVGIESFDRMAAIYNVLELSTAVKPWLLSYLLNTRGFENVVYFDPDIRIFDRLDELEPLMREQGLVLTPHATTPMPRDGEKPNEADILIAGTYNLGFMGINRGPQADKLLDWWAERLLTDCIIAPERGYFVDQRWMDFVHGLTKDFHVLHGPTYNVAYWNLHSRSVTRGEEGYYVDGRPLRFFHFSGFDPEVRHLLSKHQSRIRLSENPALTHICDEYAEALLAKGYEKVKDWPYTYEALPNGMKFDQFMRGLYTEIRDSGELDKSIFDPEGADMFIDLLNEPAAAGGGHGITRYLYQIYTLRGDLRREFPNLDGPDGPRFSRWAWESGRREVPIPEVLLPLTPQTEGDSATSRRAGRSSGVNVAGYFRSELGVGEAGRQVITALDTQSVKVAPVGLAAPSSRQGHEYAFFGAFEPPFPVNLICVNADVLPDFAKDIGPRFFGGRYSIGLWWWEVNEFPERWMASFKHLDEIWVGSQHVADAISRVSPIPVVKITIPVSMPNTAQMDRSELGMPDDFVFLFSFDYNSVFERKNPLAIVEAFEKAFPPGSGASLILKCINSSQDRVNHERLLVATMDRPDIRVIDHYVPMHEKNAMVANCDCYVSLHRSEGFGFTPAEAMYLGKPVIATAYSGNLDFMTPRNSYLVDYSLKPIGEGAGPYPPTGEWAEPDVEQAAGMMRHVFEHQDEAIERGRLAAQDIRKTNSPEAAGRTMIRRLKQIETKRGKESGSSLEPPRLDTEPLAERIARSPEVPAASSVRGRFGSLVRRAVLRLNWPFEIEQKKINEQFLKTARLLDANLRQAVQRLESQSAAGYADTLAQLRRQNGRIDDAAGEMKTVETRLSSNEARADAMAKELQDFRRLDSESRAIPYMSGSPFETFEDPEAGIVSGYVEGGEASGGAETYGEFEDVFRGPEDFIRERQRRYLGILGDRQPVLDVGCGRGEFLDLLRETGVEYIGIDLDPGMVERCREKGHEQVKLADANSYLEGLADGSLGVIFCAQVIEHLPYDELLRFLTLSHAKLKPDGLLIAETVNPHSIPAMKTFWVDLTHQHPIFPEVALTLCRIHGFEAAYVFHPNGTGNIEVDRYQTGEYTVVARNTVWEKTTNADL